ncbi:H(+)/Cl(-) exchange transporter ClcA [Gilliamella sp. wkB112]|uniref:H(+)/Cl(-) exchange transporter ClcA n=1 Tax=Gilliamella sp. wkB112 TaxID=3120257 RepID=UPI00080DEC27|nr:H(+)/Cl(-) exchange transporter ClcA [Gilliamella apicola]OCG00815.1 chloride channel protein [Gilliamella apicola]
MPSYSSIKKHLHLFHKIKRIQEKAPLMVLIIAGVIGTITGIIGVMFQYAVNWVISIRKLLILHLFDNIWLTYLAIFCITGAMGLFAYYLVERWAPESGGSGIPEIEGALMNLRPVRWRYVLPVKFIGGLGALGSGMVLGREGPTVQIGGNVGAMICDLLKIKNIAYRHTFLATGAAAGITAAFNAPLAGILFIIEEMRPQFRYSLTSIKAIFVGVIMASIMYQFLFNQTSVFQIGHFNAVPIQSLWLYLILGALFGGIGVISNKCILLMQDRYRQFYQRKSYNFLATGFLLAGIFGVTSFILPEITGSGFDFIPDATFGKYAIGTLFLILLMRFITTVLCFSSGAPGGIFAPTLALGTTIGIVFGLFTQQIFPNYRIELGACAIIGMGGLFAATVRAPLTGIVLVMEMSDNYQLILPMIITCLGATLIAQALGGVPLYSAILERILLRSKSVEAEKTEQT